MATPDIFIRTYSGDLAWLAYCLKSCQKFAKGFNQIHVVVPESELHLFSHLTVERVHGWTPCTSDGYLDQQATKLYADTISDADFICHIDADTIWSRDVTPLDLMPNGKAVILYEDGVESHWSPIVQRALGWPLQSDFMRRAPQVYPRFIYGEFRKWMKDRHNIELKDWIARQPYRQFTEYNTLGSWAWETWHDSFEWGNPSEHPTFVNQEWSWGGLTPEIRAKMDGLLN